MAALIGLLTSRIGKIIAALLGGAAFVFGLLELGQKQQRDKDRINDLEDFVETKEKIDGVEASDDRAGAIDRLHDNGLIR
jgi:hypothetical protein